MLMLINLHSIHSQGEIKKKKKKKKGKSLSHL